MYVHVYTYMYIFTYMYTCLYIYIHICIYMKGYRKIVHTPWAFNPSFLSTLPYQH